MYTVKIENSYSDGHESKREVLVEAPPEGCDDDDLTAWFEDKVWPETGDGHGTDSSLSSYYLATIIAADREDHVGQWYEWV